MEQDGQPQTVHVASAGRKPIRRPRSRNDTVWISRPSNHKAPSGPDIILSVPAQISANSDICGLRPCDATRLAVMQFLRLGLFHTHSFGSAQGRKPVDVQVPQTLRLYVRLVVSICALRNATFVFDKISFL